jgi:hypothetical protein
MLPTAAKRIWDEVHVMDPESLVHPDVAALKLPPNLRKNVEESISLLVDTVKPMADDLGV